ncbi:MAG: tol-pal system protein YbgF [Succinivibrionaceae bacterium]
MLKLQKLCCSIAIVCTGLFATSVFAETEIEKLQKQLSARDTAILDMQNRIDAQEQTLRVMSGSIEELNLKISNLEKLLNDVLKSKNIESMNQNIVSANKNNEQVLLENTDIIAPVMEQKTQQEPPKTVVIKNVSKEQEAYDKAYEFVSKNDFDNAVAEFNKFIKNFPNSSLIPNSYYWLGQIDLKNKNYESAKQNFLNVTKYKNSNKRADAIYKLGQVSEFQNSKDKAKKYYLLVIKSYPKSTEAMLSQKSLDALNK